MEVSATDVVLYERWMNNEIMAALSERGSVRTETETAGGAEGCPRAEEVVEFPGGRMGRDHLLGLHPGSSRWLRAVVVEALRREVDSTEVSTCLEDEDVRTRLRIRRGSAGFQRSPGAFGAGVDPRARARTQPLAVKRRPYLVVGVSTSESPTTVRFSILYAIARGTTIVDVH